MNNLLLPLKILKRKLSLFSNYYYDYKKMVKYSSAVSLYNTKDKLAARIIMMSHGIEKGLSLENTRLGFGLTKIIHLSELVSQYIDSYNTDYVTEMAIASIKSYIEFHKDSDCDISSVKKKFETLCSFSNNSIQAGTTAITKSELHENAKINNFESFCKYRYSVRQFSDQKVNSDDIAKAVDIAKKTPSACNRQSSNVYAFFEPENIDNILKIGGGAVGFENMPAILIVTSNLTSFISSGERYQCWIDGGMYAMSLIYALHSLGLVTCCMNWSKEKAIDIKMHNSFSIPSSENIIVLIGVGHPKEKFAVATSPRKPLKDVLHIQG